MSNHRDLLSGLFWLAISVFVCFESARCGIGTFHSPGPGLFPFWSAVVMGASAIVILVAKIFKKDAKLIADLWRGLEWKKVVYVVVSLFLYPLFLPSLGYILATFGLMVLSIRVMGRAKIWFQAGSALIITCASYLIFYSLLGVMLPKGFLGF